MAILRIKNSFLLACFDVNTGSLTKLVCKRTGWHIQGEEQFAESFRLLVPLPGRQNHAVIGKNQRLTSYELSEDGKRLTLIWDKLQSECGITLDITCKGIVTDEGGLLRFEAEITNRSPYIIEDFSFPCIGDLRRPPGETNKWTRMSYGYSGMSRASLYPAFNTERGYWGTEYPTQIVTEPYNSFVICTNERDQGLYFGLHDTDPRYLVSYFFELRPGNQQTYGTNLIADSIGDEQSRTEFKVVHFPFVRQGSTVRTSPIVFAPYLGSWHKAVDIYKNWRKTWFIPLHRPQWLKEVNSWHQIQMNSSDDSLRFGYRDLVEYGKACAEHGIQAIQLVGWAINGQDGCLPSHETDSRLGTLEELIQAVSEVQNLGVKVILYEKYTFAETGTEWFKEELHNFASKDVFGNIHSFPGYMYGTPSQLCGINTHRLAVMCLQAQGWRDIIRREFVRCLDIGADGVLFDENFHHSGMVYCYDPRHGHQTPAYNYLGNSILERELRSVAKERNPDFIFCGEGNYDTQTRFYHLSYARVSTGYTHYPHTAVQRYIDPYSDIMVGVMGYDDREILNLCLLYRYIISYEPRNFKGKLEEFPLTLEYGKQVDSLRRRYKEYLWDGEYLDTRNATVLANGEAHQDYAVYKARSGKKAIVIANHDRDLFVTLDICMEGCTHFLMAAPEKPEPIAISTQGVKLPPRSAAVFIEGWTEWQK